MKEVPFAIAQVLNDKLTDTWEITTYYWYPLYDSVRPDVIAFQLTFINNTVIHQVLEELHVKEVFEMHEDRTLWMLDVNEMDISYDERFWFTKNMEWVIYVSHEGSVAFGGEQLIRCIQAKVPCWPEKLF